MVRALAAGLLLLAGCGGPVVDAEGDPAITVHPRISPTPPMKGEALVAVEVLDAGAPAPGETRVTATALREGHAPGNPWVLEPGDPGWWSGMVTFPAEGALRLEFHVILPGGRHATFRYPVTVARRPGP